MARTAVAERDTSKTSKTAEKTRTRRKIRELQTIRMAIGSGVLCRLSSISIAERCLGNHGVAGRASCKRFRSWRS